MKTGAPSIATTIPTGTTDGATTVRPMVSAATSSTPPESADIGSRYWWLAPMMSRAMCGPTRSEEHTSELQSRGHLVCRLLLEKKKTDGSQKHQPCSDEDDR